MKTDIERKFLVQSDEWRSLCTRTWDIRQGYLAGSPEVRVRLIEAGDITDCYLTIIGARVGVARQVFEYPIPYEDAIAMLELAKRKLQKKRHHLVCQGQKWTIDEFPDICLHPGLLLAETKTDSNLLLPEWIGDEVTGNSRFNNLNLAWESK